MARDLAGMGQQIEQLKASIEQLKTGQQQMSRDMAKNSEIKNSEIKTGTTEQKPRPRISAISPPPLRAAALPARMPRPVYSPPLAASSTLPPAAAAPVYVPAPAPPVQATAQPDGEPVVRPPMPLR
jgi:TolA-binding protein